MSIRKRTPEDFSAIARLLESVRLPAKGLDRTEGWVSEQDGRIVGHVAMEVTPDAAVIRSLVVEATRQGQGLGGQLLDAAQAQAGSRIQVLKTDSIGPWVQRRGYQPATLAEIPASVLGTTQFEGSLCSGYPVFMRTPGSVQDPEIIKSAVRQRYGALAGGGGSCCAPAASGSRSGCCDSSLAVGYQPEDLAAVPDGANLGLGCGNPVALASLKAGEVVLDLGSGAGFDAFLAAQRVGAGGRVIGVDMTPEMLAKARELAARHGYANVEFRQGDIEQLPVEDGTVDAIISNCVINLSTDKARVFRESFRVLKPGGRLMVSDLVLLKPLPPAMRGNMDAYAACLAGALLKEDYLGTIQTAGFQQVEVVGESRYPFGDPTSDQVATARKIEAAITAADLKAASEAVVSVKISALKPVPAEDTPRRIRVFDPAMCCSTGVCGPSVDPKLVRFSADLEWLKTQGVAVERCNLAQQPMAFAQDPEVRAALEAQGEAALPLIKVDGRVKSQGSYPIRAQLAAWLGVAEPAPSLYTEAVQELVALGAAIAANCEPCFKFHYDKARRLGVSKEDMLSAVRTAQAVKETPAKAVLGLAERYLEPSSGERRFRATGNKRLATGSAKTCCGGSDSGTPCC